MFRRFELQTRTGVILQLMESAESKALRSAVRILEAPESPSIVYVARAGPLDLRRDALAVS